MKVNSIVDSQKFEINMLWEEKMNHVEKFWFLETTCQSLLKRKDTLTQEIKC